MLALQALCAFEAVGDTFSERLTEFINDPRILVDLQIETPIEPEVAQFADHVARGAWGRRREIDGMLERALIRWSLSRITPVDRNILRLGLFELLEPGEAPMPVAIHEAIELAKRFGDTDSPSFVNGVLDAVRRDQLGGKDADPAPSAAAVNPQTSPDCPAPSGGVDGPV